MKSTLHRLSVFIALLGFVALYLYVENQAEDDGPNPFATPEKPPAKLSGSNDLSVIATLLKRLRDLQERDPEETRTEVRILLRDAMSQQKLPPSTIRDRLNELEPARRIVILSVLDELTTEKPEVPASQNANVAIQAASPEAIVVALLSQIHQAKSADSPKSESVDADVVLTVISQQRIAKAILGPTWGKIATSKQTEFVDALSGLFVRTMVKALRKYDLSHPKTSAKANQEKEDRTVVAVELSPPGEGSSSPIAFRFNREESGEWRIYDCIIENVGIVANFRNEIPALIERDGTDAALERILGKQ